MKYPIISILLIIMHPVFAQNSLRPNIYLDNLNYYNAGADINDDTHTKYLSFYLKDKFVPEENNAVWSKPVNVYLNYLGNINQKSFFNISYIYDGYSFYNRNTFYGGYGRKYEIGKRSSISFGIRAVVNLNHIDWDKVGQFQTTPAKRLRINPDLDFGILYQWKGLNLGISGKNLFSSKIKKDKEAIIKDWQEFYLNLSYRFNMFQNNLAITPFILYFKERNINLDAGLNLSFFKKAEVSYALRLLELRGIYAARFAIGKRMQIGAAFDHSSIFSDTNVDFLLGFRFN